MSPASAAAPSSLARATLRSAAPALLLSAALLVPFLDKAFTIDDPVFLEEARHARVDPLHPSAFEMVWGHASRVRASSVTTSGPVMAWLLVPAVASDRPERVAHALQLVFLAVAVCATVALGLRLGLSPRWSAAAGLLVAGSPAVLALAGTAMPDVPAMALGVAGLERLVAWRDRRGVHRAISAALLLALAPLARAHLAVLLPVGALLLALGPARLGSRAARWVAWLPLAFPPILAASVLVITRDPSSAAPEVVGAISARSGAANLPRNLFSFGVHWVLAVPLAIPWVLLRWRALARRWPVVLVACATAALLRLLGGGAWNGWPMVAAAALGFTVLLDLLVEAWARRDPLRLALAAWLFAPLPAALYEHLPAKYLVAAAPAVALLVALEGSRHDVRKALSAVALVAAAGAGLGIAILRADAAFAALGRRAAEELVAPRVAAGERVWFTPQWGFLWYATRAGGLPATTDPPGPARGDLLVTAESTFQHPELQAVLAARHGPRARHLARIEDRRPGGRTMERARGIGFFSNLWGDLPWGWSAAPLDTFDLWRLE